MLPEAMIKTLTEKHKRPDNFTNLQVPKSDNSVWSALQPQTKTYETMLPFKKRLGPFTSAFVPIIKQMELFNTLHKSKAKDIPVRELKKLSQESFQLFCVGLSATNQRRQELLKRNLDTKFHKICEKAYLMSATDLFLEAIYTERKLQYILGKFLPTHYRVENPGKCWLKFDT